VRLPVPGSRRRLSGQQQQQYERFSTDAKNYIKLLVIILQWPKAVTYAFLCLQQLVLFEVQYLSYFDEFELAKQDIKSSLG